MFDPSNVLPPVKMLLECSGSAKLMVNPSNWRQRAIWIVMALRPGPVETAQRDRSAQPVAAIPNASAEPHYNQWDSLRLESEKGQKRTCPTVPSLVRLSPIPDSGEVAHLRGQIPQG